MRLGLLRRQRMLFTRVALQAEHAVDRFLPGAIQAAGRYVRVKVGVHHGHGRPQRAEVRAVARHREQHALRVVFVLGLEEAARPIARMKKLIGDEPMAGRFDDRVVGVGRERVARVAAWSQLLRASSSASKSKLVM